MSTAGGVELRSKGSLGLGSRGHYPAIDSMALWEGELHGAKSSSYSREVGKAEFMWNVLILLLTAINWKNEYCEGQMKHVSGQQTAFSPPVYNV